MRSLADIERQILGNFRGRLLATPGAAPIAPPELAEGTLSDAEFEDVLTDLNETLPGIVVRYGLSRSILDLGLIGYAILACDNIGTAIDLACRYHTLTSSTDDVVKTDDGSRVTIRLRSRRRGPARRNALAEDFATGQWQILTELLPTDIDQGAIRIDFAFAPPTYVDLYGELMPGDTHMNAAATAVSFPSEWQQLPIATADATLQQVCRAQCDDLLESLSHANPIVDDVRRVVLSAPTNRAPVLADTAHVLAMSPRTLERRLHDAGVTFRQITNEIRMDLAAQYVLLDAVGGHELAAMLGYSQPSALYRAFKAWHGMSPSNYRRSMLHPGESP